MGSVAAIDSDDRSEFIHPPRWRTRASESSLRVAVALTFTITFVAGLVLLLLTMVGLDALGAPAWVVLMPWLVPVAGVTLWSMVRPRTADRHDDDRGWIDYVTTRALVGEERPRPASLRVLAAIVVGGPIGWIALVGLALELAGVF